MKDPTVTILMTVYNGGKYLEPTLKSVLSQTHKDFEFLIINDCSRDNSAEIIRGMNDSRIVLHNNEMNLGQSKSLNVGLKMAKGDYIARMDADDLAFPNWIERQVAFIRDNPEYAVVSTSALVIDENNRIRKSFRSPVLWEDIILRALINSPINHVGAFINKEAALKYGGYNDQFRVAADYNLWAEFLIRDQKITRTSSVLVIF